jgi:hypothetical protein
MVDVQRRAAVGRDLDDDVVERAGGVVAGDLEDEIAPGAGLEAEPLVRLDHLTVRVGVSSPLAWPVRPRRYVSHSQVSSGYFTVSGTDDATRWREGLPEPDAFNRDEFLAWRGLIRVRETVVREIDDRLRRAGHISLTRYGVLITLVTAPTLRRRMSDLGARRMLTPSGITP